MNKNTIALTALALTLSSLYAGAQNINLVAGLGGGPGYNGDSIQASTAQLSAPWDVKIDANGNIFIADAVNQRIRKINTSGVITTYAGTGAAGFSGDFGPATAATMDYPGGMAIDSKGDVFFADIANNNVRVITTSGTMATVAGNATAGYSGDGGQSTAAQLNGPYGLAFDASGNLYIAEGNSDVVRMVNTSGVISTVAGNHTKGPGFSGDGGPATSAELKGPTGIAFDAKGNMYIADANNNVIRIVNTSGNINTFAGDHALGAGYAGDYAPATAAQMYDPVAVTVNSAGTVFIADSHNNVIREVDTSGLIETVVGNGLSGFSGDGGPALAAELVKPTGMCLDAGGLLYIADNGNDVIRDISKPLAINELSTNNTMSVYPNPSNGVFTIKSSVASHQSSVVEVYNMMGEKIYSKQLSPDSYRDVNCQLSINLSGTANGLYLLKVTNADGTMMTSRIEIAK